MDISVVLFIAANAYKCTVFRLILSDLKNPYFSTAFHITPHI